MEVLIAEREGAPFLECRDADGRLHLFRTAGRGDRPLSVGRRPDMDVAIAWDLEVSSLHAELVCVGGEWTVTDVGSTNGKFLNEGRIEKRRRLHEGDRVRVGSTVLVFRASPSLSGTVEPTHVAAYGPAPPELTRAQRRPGRARARPRLSREQRGDRRGTGRHRRGGEDADARALRALRDQRPATGREARPARGAGARARFRLIGDRRARRRPKWRTPRVSPISLATPKSVR
jgi:hypothetical protein